MRDAEQRRAYHREYMARYRAEQRATRLPTTRERVITALQNGPKTVYQVQRALGDTYERPTVYYHLRRLAEQGLIVQERSKHRFKDDSLTQYRLRMPGEG